MSAAAPPIPIPDAGRLLSVRQLADLLSCHPRSIWRKVSAGELPAPVRIGGLTRWRHADIIRHVEALPASR